MSPLAQRFAAAVRILIGDGPIKHRLSRAYAEQLEGISDAELPAGLRRDFGELDDALHRIAPAGSETRVRASVQKMSPGEAAEHAETIVKLYVELMNGLERAEPLKVVPTKQPPHFLASRGQKG